MVEIFFSINSQHTAFVFLLFVPFFSLWRLLSRVTQFRNRWAMFQREHATILARPLFCWWHFYLLIYPIRYWRKETRECTSLFLFCFLLINFFFFLSVDVCVKTNWCHSGDKSTPSLSTFCLKCALNC